jgi:hypothetical protein
MARLDAVIDSPRFRFGLGSLAALVLLIGIVAFANTRDSGSPSAAGSGSGLTPAQLQNEQQKYGKVIPTPPVVLDVTRSFIRNAVLLEDMAAAWAQSTTNVHGATSKARWLAGTASVVPYPASEFGQSGIIRIVRSRERNVMLLVLITPKEGSTFRQQDFFIELVPEGVTWKVDYWGTKGRIGAPVPLANP